MRKRSPLVVAAYVTLAAAIALMLLGAGAYWTVGSAGMAVLLALGEIAIQLYARQARALLLGLKVVAAFGVVVAVVGLITAVNSYIAEGQYSARGAVMAVGGTILAAGAYAAARSLARDQGGHMAA